MGGGGGAETKNSGEKQQHYNKPNSERLRTYYSRTEVLVPILFLQSVLAKLHRHIKILNNTFDAHTILLTKQ